MVQMAYVKVAHGVWVDWRTILGGQKGNVPPYQTKIVQAHPSIPPHPQILLQWVPPILVVAQINNGCGTIHLPK